MYIEYYMLIFFSTRAKDYFAW